MGLTLRLFLLALCALIPAFIIQAYDGMSTRREWEKQIHQNSLQTARLTASEIDRIFFGVERILLVVSREASVRNLDAEVCTSYISSLLPEFPHLLSLSVLDKDARIRCGEKTSVEGFQVSDRSAFKEAISGVPFAIGEYEGGPSAKAPVLPLAIPLKDADGTIIGVIAAAMDLNWLAAQLEARGYPEGGSVTVADRNGVILARQPFPNQFIGTKIPDVFRSFVTASTPGTAEVMSQDGTLRVLGYVPVSEIPKGVYVSTGIGSERAFAAVNAATRRALVTAAVALLAAIGAAWIAGRVFVRRPVSRLLSAVEGWGRGDLSARTGLHHTSGELGRIGAAFDRVVADVQRREEALLESEERLRLAIEATGIGIWDVNPLTGSRRWSPEFRAILGLPPDTSPDPERLSQLIHPEDRVRVNEAYAAAYSPGAPGHYEAECRIYRADNREERWVALTGRIQFDENGRATRGIGTMRDVTDRRRAEAALRESEARLRALADNLPNGMVYQVTATPDGHRRFLYISEGVERLFGYKAIDILADPTVLYRAILDEDLAGFTQAEAEALANESLFSAEVRMHQSDGSLRWFQLASAPRRLPDHSLVWDGVAIDIQQRKLAEQELRRLNETLEHRIAERTAELLTANHELHAQMQEREQAEATLRQMQRLEAVGQLTSGVAHDFNNLLTVILGNISFLGRLDLDERARKRLEMMRAAAQRGAKLTEQLLAFSRRQRLEPRPVDLNQSISEMTYLLNGTLGGALNLDFQLQPQLPPALVDPTQLELVVLNLALNARDAMPVGGTLTISTGNETVARQPLRPEDPPLGLYVTLCVSDNGSGMSEETRERAFEPFFTTKEVGKGSGLGLAQVFGFAKQSGGGVSITTKPGEGTAVCVYLPAALEGAYSEPVETSAGTRIHAETRIAEARVLVVDDDAAVREVTAGMLRELGYSVLEADSGAAGLEVLRHGPMVHLLLVDFAMPGMNGAQFATAAQDLRPDIPILFVSGYADFNALRDLGDGSILQKPFETVELARKVDMMLQNRSTTHPPKAADQPQ